MYILGITRVILLVLIILVFLPFVTISKIISQNNHAFFIQLLYKTLCLVLGIRIKLHNFKPKKGTLFISNHSSYLDVLILGSVIKYVCFTPKAEVRKWPIVGYCAYISDCVFINRKNKKASIENSNEIMLNISRGKNVHIFPEGTTNNGRKLLEFKPTLLFIAEKNKINITSVAIVYKKLGFKTIKEGGIDYIAWYGTASLLPHMIKLFSKLSIEVHLFFKKVEYNETHTRKEISNLAKSFIEEKLGI